tara:strand:+ start:938 stop:1174 length:237 start_codon:yes stop_codon:yes gene_type:complete
MGLFRRELPMSILSNNGVVLRGIAKCVGKNIDGDDVTGAARRVETRASCWELKQFQQLGNTSVTVLARNATIEKRKRK